MALYMVFCCRFPIKAYCLFSSYERTSVVIVPEGFYIPNLAGEEPL